MKRASQQWDANRFWTRLRKLRQVSRLNGERATGHVLSAELLEQALELVWRGKKDQAFEQARGLAVGDFEFLAVGLLPDAGEKEVAVFGALELVQLEHLVGVFEVLLLLLVEHAVEGRRIRAGDVMLGDVVGRVFRLELVDVLFLEALCTRVVVDIALPLLLLFAAAAFLVLLGHGG
jgi:hypothetical protein